MLADLLFQKSVFAILKISNSELLEVLEVWTNTSRFIHYEHYSFDLGEVNYVKIV